MAATNESVSWLINFSLVISYYRATTQLSTNVDGKGGRDRDKGIKKPTLAGAALSTLINLLNSALAGKPGQKWNFDIYVVKTDSKGQFIPITTFDEFLTGWYLIRAKLPGAINSTGQDPGPLLTAMDNFYNTWIAPKIPKK